MSGSLMRAEMAEQPAVLARLAERFDEDVARVRAVVPRPLAGVVFVARGSSDNAVVYGRYLAELAAGRPAGLAAPSLHTLYHAPVDASGYLVVALSQSGATPEIVTVCERLRAAGARSVADRQRRGRAARALHATVRAQQLALALAGARGRDADAPPGLSKVTVTE